MPIQIFSGRIAFPSLKQDISLSNPRIEKLKAPPAVILHLNQHQGSPAVPVVKRGDSVCVGTLIGEPNGDFSAAVHSSVSGRVKQIGLFPHPMIGEGLAVKIESDGKDTMDPAVTVRDAGRLSNQEIHSILKTSGVVGLGGSAVPTHLKVDPGKCGTLHTLILNGLECEPYLASSYLNMMERPYEIIQGAKILKRLMGAERVLLAVGKNHLEALETVNSKLFTTGENFIESAALPALYPQGEEHRLIKDLLSREVPPGKEASEIGVVVLNVETVLAVYEAVRMGKPLYERVVTVTGECLVQPRNLLARIGTPLNDLIRACRGFLRKPGRLLVGGPMTGVHQEDLSTPMVKTTNALIALPPEEMIRDEEVEPCIRCGYCVEACPVFLNPCQITLSVEHERWDIVREFGASACVECGNCSYVCPSKRPMLELMRQAKGAFVA